ncbi:hypothetical protein L3X38_014366 [Prunus dulcis]|uniref:Inhibitor I9 domain-containing protein n=1 Tax=Prunus dulcis TaxID=3755 RepID=A0AAD4WQQ5_PRUDU|nr:hypothetical protein L3X38_014366 [Prunus dulcis]
MGDRPKHEVSTATISSLHVNMLQNVVGNGVAQQESLLVHSYKRSLNGFAAKLMAEEAQKMGGEDGVVSIFPSAKPMSAKLNSDAEFAYGVGQINPIRAPYPGLFVETETREEEEEEEKKRKTDENAPKTDEQNSESLSQINDPPDDLSSS